MLTHKGLATLTSILLFTLITSLTQSYVFAVASFLLLILMLINIISFGLTCTALDDLEVVRKLDTDAVIVSEVFNYELVFKNRSPRHVGPLMVWDPIPNNLDLLGGSPVLEAIKPWTDHSMRRGLKAVEMGEAAFGDVEVRLFDRLGLLWTRRAFSLKVLVKVYPSVTQSVRRGVGARRLLYRSAGTVVWRKRLKSEFSGIREYSPGDDHRLIAWKAMAKSPSHAPMTKEMEEEIDADVLIVIANRQTMAEGERGRRKIDLAVDAALAVAREVTRLGHPTSLLFYKDGVPQMVTGSHVQLAERIYNMSFHSGEDMSPLIDAALSDQAKPGIVIVILDSPYPRKDDPSSFAKIAISGSIPKALLLSTPDFFKEPETQNREERRVRSLLWEQEKLHEEQVASMLADAQIPVQICNQETLVEAAVETFLYSKEMLR